MNGDFFNNAGLFEATGGTGPSVIGIGVTFNNTGTVELDGGTLQFYMLSNTDLINLAGGTLVSDTGIAGNSILSQLQSDYDSGRWDGTNGITSTLAAVDPGTAVGYAINGSSVTLMFTWLGDANLDGIVNSTDLAAISHAGTTWTTGDFNYDSVVNADDYSLFMLGLSKSGGANISTTLPEPGLILASGFYLLACFPRRRLGCAR